MGISGFILKDRNFLSCASDSLLGISTVTSSGCYRLLYHYGIKMSVAFKVALRGALHLLRQDVLQLLMSTSEKSCAYTEVFVALPLYALDGDL